MTRAHESRPATSLTRSCAIVLWLALGGLAVEGRPAGATDGVVQSENDVERIVREWREQRDTPAASALRRLSGLGRTSDAALLAQAVKECGAGAHAAPTCQLLIEALSALPRERLRALAQTRAQADLSGAERELLLSTFGRSGVGADLDVCLNLAVQPPADAHELESRLAALRVAVRDIAGRDRAVWEMAQRLIALQEPFVQHALVTAAGERALQVAAGDEAALHFLGWCFGALPAARLEALSAIQRVSVVLPEADEELLVVLRKSLDGSSGDALADVALVLGRFEDAESVPQLIVLLAHPHAGVRENAHWSLQRISGLHLVPEVERWQHWHAEELSWWESGWPTQFLRLQSGDATAVRLAILELGRHRFRRERLARAVADTLAGADRELVQLACAVLSQLGSRAAVGSLIDSLEHADLEARQSAWNCLKSLTRLELPLDAARWRAQTTRT